MTLGMARLSFVLAFVWATSAWAGPAEDALAELDRGIALFQAGDLTAAREAFVRARDLVPDKANPYRWLGLVDARLGRCQDSIAELEVFLQRVPSSDPRAIEAITLRDRCREELQPKVGTLVIDSTPSGAAVRIDDAEGQPAGATPFHRDGVPAGSHLVILSHPGFETITRSVKLGRNETVRLELTLRPAAAPSVNAPGPPLVPAARSTPQERKRSRAWIVGVVVGAAVVAAVGVGLGVGLSPRSEDMVLTPVKSQ